MTKEELKKAQVIAQAIWSFTGHDTPVRAFL